MEHKTFGVAELKATGPASAGTFEAIVSVFGNVDKGGDRMLPGFFVDSLKAPPEGRGYPPIVWSHLWGVVPIGSASRAEEVTGYKTVKGDTVDGLLIEGELFVDEHQTAKEVHVAMTKTGGDGLPVLRDFSFGYSTSESIEAGDDGFEAVTKEHIRDLVKGELYEVGPTLVGMNEQAGLISAKSMPPATLEALVTHLKAGARNSANDSKMLKEIHDLTTELGVECTTKTAASIATTSPIAATLFKALEAKGYSDIDRYGVYLLTGMVDAGSSYIANSEDDARVTQMREMLREVLSLLELELEPIAETDDGKALRDTLAKAIPESSKTRHPAGAAPSDVRELAFAFPAPSH